jgi:hypothetical protein
MTRSLVILIAVLAAASLGASAQEHTTASQSNTVAAQNNTRPGQQSSSTPPAAVRRPDSATSGSNHGIQASDPADADSPNRAQLPQTSTILPLLGLIGLGSLLAGLFARR